MPTQNSLPCKRKNLEAEINQDPVASSHSFTTPYPIGSNQLQSPLAVSDEPIHVVDSPCSSPLWNSKRKLTNYHFDQEAGERDLAAMIILHEYPLSMVDHIGFRKFCNTIQPLFKVVSRNSIKKDIMKIYDVEKEKSMKLLSKNQGRIAVTYDLWTSNNQNKGYMTITAHFIDNNWVLQSRLLRFIRVPCQPTKDVLSTALMDCFYDWNIDTKLSTLTVDNCSINDAVVQDILGELQCTSLMLHGDLFHIRCCAHVLNLIVQDGLSVIGEPITKIRASIAYWTASPKRKQKFDEAACQAGIQSTKKLTLDCKTRWNSTYLMLETAFIYKGVFTHLKHCEPHFRCLPSEEEWELAQQIFEKLNILYETALLFFGTKYPTANVYFRQLCEIRLQLSSWIRCGNDVIRKMAMQMDEKFSKYWNVIYGVMGVAIVFDPRYKLKLLDFVFPLIYGDDAADQIMKIRGLCTDLFLEYQSKQENCQAQPSLTASSPHSGDSSGEGIMADFYRFLDKESSLDPGQSELEYYLEERLMRITPDFDVLSWWKASGPRYPILQKIARDILSIPISTVTSEFAFTIGGKVLSPHHNKLHSDTLEALVCSKNWLWADLKDQVSCSTIYDDSDSEDENFEDE